MGKEVAKRITEKSIIRLIKIIAGVKKFGTLAEFSLAS